MFRELKSIEHEIRKNARHIDIEIFIATIKISVLKRVEKKVQVSFRV